MSTFDCCFCKNGIQPLNWRTTQLIFYWSNFLRTKNKMSSKFYILFLNENNSWLRFATLQRLNSRKKLRAKAMSRLFNWNQTIGYCNQTPHKSGIIVRHSIYQLVYIIGHIYTFGYTNRFVLHQWFVRFAILQAQTIKMILSAWLLPSIERYFIVISVIKSLVS